MEKPKIKRGKFGCLLIPYKGDYVTVKEAAELLGLTPGTTARFFGKPLNLESLEEVIEWRNEHKQGAHSGISRRNSRPADRYFFRGEDRTLREIAEMTGVTYNSVASRVRTWENKGCRGDVDFEPKPWVNNMNFVQSGDKYADEWEAERHTHDLPTDDDLLADWKRLRRTLGGEKMLGQLFPQYANTIKEIVNELEEKLKASQKANYVYYEDLPRKQPYTNP